MSPSRRLLVALAALALGALTVFSLLRRRG